MAALVIVLIVASCLAWPHNRGVAMGLASIAGSATLVGAVGLLPVLAAMGVGASVRRALAA